MTEREISLPPSPRRVARVIGLTVAIGVLALPAIVLASSNRPALGQDDPANWVYRRFSLVCETLHDTFLTSSNSWTSKLKSILDFVAGIDQPPHPPGFGVSGGLR